MSEPGNTDEAAARQALTAAIGHAYMRSNGLTWAEIADLAIRMIAADPPPSVVASIRVAAKKEALAPIHELIKRCDGGGLWFGNTALADLLDELDAAIKVATPTEQGGQK